MSRDSKKNVGGLVSVEDFMLVTYKDHWLRLLVDYRLQYTCAIRCRLLHDPHILELLLNNPYSNRSDHPAGKNMWDTSSLIESVEVGYSFRGG
jgi:hypothetical protein